MLVQFHISGERQEVLADLNDDVSSETEAEIRATLAHYVRAHTRDDDFVTVTVSIIINGDT